LILDVSRSYVAFVTCCESIWIVGADGWTILTAVIAEGMMVEWNVFLEGGNWVPFIHDEEKAGRSQRGEAIGESDHGN